MKAIVQVRYGLPGGLELREIEKPAIGDDGVLVRVHAASVNAMDWHLMGRLPHLIGWLLRATRTNVRGVDLAGRVEAVGKSVTRIKPGDEVFGAGPGAFAEYSATIESRVAPKPLNLTFEQAAALPVAGLTALQGLRDYAKLQPGQRVIVYGAGGGVGTFAVQIAKALGARVTAVTRTASVDVMRSIGADEVIDYTRDDFVRRPERYDVLFDLGGDRSLAECRRVLVPNGLHVTAGAPPGLWPLVSRLAQSQVRSRLGRQRIGSFMAKVRHEDLLALKDLAEAGKLTPVIHRTYALAETPDAIGDVGTRGVRGKAVIEIERPAI